MLIGQYIVTVGEKSRIAFPKRFRQELGHQLIITRGFEKSLIILSEKNWKSLLEGTEELSLLKSGARDTQRFLLGSASFLELDAQGRFVLPEYLRSFGEIRDEVVFVGLSKRVEMWDRGRWETYQKEKEENISQIAEKLIETIEKK